MDNRFSNGTTHYILLYIILLHFWQKQFNWESGLTETVRLAFHEKTADYYTKQIYEWKQLWLKGNTPKYINPAVWLELQEHRADQATIEKSIKNQPTTRAIVAGKVFMFTTSVLAVCLLKKINL